MDDIFEIDATNPHAVKVFLFGLLVDCPAGNNPKNCQLHEIRKCPLQNRIDWLINQTYDQQAEIYLQHKKCLSEKEKEI